MSSSLVSSRRNRTILRSQEIGEMMNGRSSAMSETMFLNAPETSSVVLVESGIGVLTGKTAGIVIGY